MPAAKPPRPPQPSRADMLTAIAALETQIAALGDQVDALARNQEIVLAAAINAERAASQG